MIVLDDLGFADLGCYGSTVLTPNIDRLANEGLRFNGFHVTPLCAPTRASLLTGRNHHAVGMGFLSDFPLPYPGYNARIPPTAASLPRLLRDSGYNTIAMGKWHLAPPDETSPSGPFVRWPLGLGFEHYYGFLEGGTNQWAPHLVRDNTHIELPSSPFDGYHLTEDLVVQAMKAVQDQQQSAPGKPFFLYFASGAMHSPHQVPEEWVEQYRGKFDAGWDVERVARFANQREIGVIPPNAQLTDRPSYVPAWTELSTAERSLFARQMEVYAAFLSHTDAQLGRFLDHLESLGVLTNTMVLVMSDNGAAGGSPVGSIDARTPNDVAPMIERIDDLGGIRSRGYYAEGWASVGNVPFKLWKMYTWLGGVRVPLIVSSPEHVAPPHRGQVAQQFLHAVDVMPTVLDVANVRIPTHLDGVTQQRVDGVSFAGLFRDIDQPGPRNIQYFEMVGSRSIYCEGWKATTDHVVSLDHGRIPGSVAFEEDRWSLYDLSEDFSESVDVASEHPRRLQMLIEMWWHEAGRNDVLPLTDQFARSAVKRRAPAKNLVLRPGGTPMRLASVARGFRMSAAIELPKVDCSGMIFAHGDWHGGWACYMRDGLVTAVFAFGDSTTVLEADGRLSLGEHLILVSFTPISEAEGSVTLEIDGALNGTCGVSTRKSAIAAASRYGRAIVGRDSGLPVSDHYEPPFIFPGRIHQVQMELADPLDDAGAFQEIADALRDD